jgi:hypothetical protein
MNKLIVPIAVATFSVTMALPAFADNPGNPGQGFENSENPNACLNAGAGNGGEFGNCSALDNEARAGRRLDQDPGNSGGNNNAPPVPPCKLCAAP